MAAAAILDFSKMLYLTQGINISLYPVQAVKILWKSLHYIWTNGSTPVCLRCMLLKFGEHCFIHAEINNIFRNSRWRPPPSWILKILHIWPKGSILAGTKCMLLKFGENCFIRVEIINIFWNPRWRPPPSWISTNLQLRPEESILAGARCMQFKFG